ncbi:MAG: GPW/gp25 family protein [Sporocytophaga sp.]|uniref:GPW/gp25 family protein n=1 Tax=Sporocytophaga TaxID=1011 RepID=UPI000418F119|nr:MULTISPECIES: GPW/gp25 family protein [Sporocytophaga]MBO9700580.1 GPW/gp25 family protein [Sporocytophaga sp.]
MKHKKTFLGVGWKFPPTFDKTSGSVMLVSEEEDIRESLFILLSTKPGERTMLPEYGCDLNKMIFESIDSSLITEMKGMIENAILYFEPRIILNEIDISQDKTNDGLLLIDVQYTIRKTNKRSNMVYPYYILEGNEARFRAVNTF